MANGNKEQIYLEQMAIYLLNALYDGLISRDLVDDWYTYSYDPTSQLAERTESSNPALAQLVDTLPLVITPQTNGKGYLYNKADFLSWVKEYEKATEK